MSTKKTNEVAEKENVREVAPAQEKSKSQQKETVIYIGPTISGVITRNTILNNGPTKSLKELIGKVPVLKEMLVPVENLSEAMNSITVEGSAMNNCYKQVVKQLKK